MHEIEYDWLRCSQQGRLTQQASLLIDLHHQPLISRFQKRFGEVDQLIIWIQKSLVVQLMCMCKVESVLNWIRSQGNAYFLVLSSKLGSKSRKCIFLGFEKGVKSISNRLSKAKYGEQTHKKTPPTTSPSPIFFRFATVALLTWRAL